MRKAERAPARFHVSRLRSAEEGADPEMDAVEAIARESFAGTGFSVAEELTRPWTRAWAARAAEGAPPAAFVVTWHVADEIHVLNVATTSSMRRRGFGRALMEEVLAYAAAERIRIVILEVRRSNRAAIKLYRAFGFTALGVRPRYYADNDEDAVEMMLSLDPESGRVLPGRDEIRIDG